MKKLIFSFLVISAFGVCQASQHDTYHVDDRGNVTKGASKISSGRCDNLNMDSYQNRRPTRQEITDVDPRQVNQKTSAIFSW